MQIAFIGDIHGNLPALEAVLAELARLHVDAIWCHGDICYGGPWPRQCAEAVRAVCRVATRGNTDDLISADAEDAIARRDRLEIGNELITWMADLAVEYCEQGLILTHATRYSNAVRLPSAGAKEDAWVAAYGPPPATVICGHSHVAFTKMIGTDLRVLNTGSIGGPLDPRSSGLISRRHPGRSFLVFPARQV